MAYKQLGALAVGAFAVLGLLLFFLRFFVIFESPVLLAVLVIVFQSAIPFIIAYFSSSSYLKTGLRQLVLLGSAMVAFGIFNVIVALGILFVNTAGWANFIVTINNSGLFILAFLTFLGSILAFFSSKFSSFNYRRRKLLIIFTYLTVGILGLFFTLLTSLDIIPPFVVSGDFTLLRQVILFSTVGLLIISSLIFGKMYLESKSNLVYWYSLGVVSIAIGVIGILVEPSLGTPLSWVGRTAQYGGAVFLLAAVLSKVPSSNTAEVMSEGFKRDKYHFNLLFANMRDGFAYHRAILDDNGKPIDYVFLEMNDAFKKITGLNSELIVGKRATEVLPGIEKSSFDWIGTYGKVATTKEPVKFESFLEPLQKWFAVSAFSPTTNYFATTIEDITERKKAEEALRQSEERFRTVFEKTALGIVIGDMEGHVVESNSALERMLGYDENKLKGKLFSEFTYPADVNLEWPLIRDLVAGKCDKYEIEKRYIRKDGEIIWVHLTGNIIFGRNKEPLIGVATIEDITERKKAEEALKQSQELINNQLEEIKSYYDNAPIGLAILDRDLRYIRVNNRFAEMDGVPVEEHIGKTVREVVPDLAEQAEELLRKIIRSGEAVRNIDFLGETASCPGEKRSWLESWIPIKDSLGKVTALYVMGEDITERKKAEEALKASEQLYRAVFDNSEDAFELIELIYDKDGKPVDQRYLKINRAFSTQTGIKEDDLTSKTAKQLLPNVEPYWFEIPDKVLKTGKTMHTESYNQDTKRYYDIYFFRYSENTVGGLFRDVTERKLLEKKLQDSERLAAIGATAGMVGHDIRNPLQAITSDVFLVRSELDSFPNNDSKQNAVDSLNEIEVNIDYINKIVADLQDYARPLNPRAQESDIKAVVQDTISRQKLPKDFKVVVNIDEQAQKIIGDPDYLKRIISNLVLNAVQAMPNGGTLTVNSIRDKQSGELVLTVEDTGVGIPDDVKDKLFTPMFTTKSKGQGFGLAVVKRMTETLGGSVTFESEHGRGTKFTVRFFPPQGAKG